MKAKVIFEDWGTISYKEAWERQIFEHSLMADLKKIYRDDLAELKKHQVNKLVFCEHPHVYTLGKSGKADHLKLDEAGLSALDAEYFKTNRGGDITYHGPGQIVGYFLFDLDCFKPDVHVFVRNIEEGVIRLLHDYGIKGERINEYTGVWIRDKDARWVKICAIGVHLSRWISMHGFALNIDTQLNYYDNIIACGIQDEDKSITSLSQLTGQKLDMDSIKSSLYAYYSEVFNF